MTQNLSLAISPGIQDIELKKGETYEGSFFVLTTDTENGIDYEISVAPLSFENDTYEIYFDYPLDYNQITKWIEIENPIGTVTSDEKQEIKYHINVPEDAPNGSQYAAFLVKQKTPENQEQQIGVSVINNSQIAMLLYSSVEGETRKEGKILENTIKPFFLNSPINVSSAVENTGNVHAPAAFVLKVFPLFSDQEVYTNEENPDTSLIIPGTTHYSERSWQETPKLGVYKVVQEIRFVDHVDAKEQITLVCPVWFMVLVIFFFISIVVYIVESIHQNKKRKKVKKSLKSIDF